MSKWPMMPPVILLCDRTALQRILHARTVSPIRAIALTVERGRPAASAVDASDRQVGIAASAIAHAAANDLEAASAVGATDLQATSAHIIAAPTIASTDATKIAVCATMRLVVDIKPRKTLERDQRVLHIQTTPSCSPPI
jgi:hypothetical protein